MNHQNHPSKTKVFNVRPVAKPRMTQRDKWLYPPRPKVARWRKYQMDLMGQMKGFKMPASGYQVIFEMPMPKTWSEKRKQEMEGKPHQQTPDKDNLEKALLDALCASGDAYIWDGRVTKIWGHEGKITIIYEE